jgi:succinoglycan biosynthesis transport protein ExoP
MNAAEKFRSHKLATDGDPESWKFCWFHLRSFLVRQWRLIAIIAVLAVVAGLVDLGMTPSRYTAQADLLVDNKKVGWTQSELTAEEGLVDDSSFETEIETTMSEKITALVARQLHLDDDPEFTAVESSPWDRLLALIKFDPGPGSDTTSAERMRRALATLRSNMLVMRSGRSYVEMISYTSLDSAKAAKIANALAAAYIEDQVQAKFETTHRATIWLEQRMEELRQQASDAYKAVQDFKSQNNVIVGSDDRPISEIELDKLSEALARARAATSQAGARLERIERVLEQHTSQAGLDIPDPVVTDALNNSVIATLRQQYLDDQAKESEWSGRYGSDHQAAQKLRSEMAALQRAIWDEISRIAEGGKSALQISKGQEEAIEKQIIDVFQASATIRQQQVKLRELRTAADTYRKIYETFLTRFEQVVQKQSFPSTTAQVLRWATPGWQTSPKTSQTLALAAIYGLGFGFMAAFARERLNRQIRTRSELEELTGKRCLTTLPALTKRRLFKRGTEENALAFRQISEAAPFSTTNEALRFVKVAIDLHGGNVIGIVSALPGEGKTTVAAGLAAFLATNGNRTLLIDGDLRNPSMSRMLGHGNRRGLFNIAADHQSADELIVSEAGHKFDFLPASGRTRPANTQDLLNSPAVAQMLEARRSQYDYVIVDLPPILPVVDVKAAAHLFDGFVLIVEWGATSTEEIVRALAASPVVSERLVGSVLNKAAAAAIAAS